MVKKHQRMCYIVMAHSKKDVRIILKQAQPDVKLERWHIARIKAPCQLYQRIV